MANDVSTYNIAPCSALDSNSPTASTNRNNSRAFLVELRRARHDWPKVVMSKRELNSHLLRRFADASYSNL